MFDTFASFFVDDNTSVTDAMSTLFHRNTLDSILTNMVAFPVGDLRSSTNVIGDNVSTSSKLVPRKGVTPQWREQLADILSAQKLSQVAMERRPPTLEQLRASPGWTEMSTILSRTFCAGRHC